MRAYFASAIIAVIVTATESDVDNQIYFGLPAHRAPHLGDFYGHGDAHHVAAPHYQDFWGHHESPHHEAPHHEVPLHHAAPHHEAPHHEAFYGHGEPHHAAYPAHDIYATPHHVEGHHEAPHHEAPHHVPVYSPIHHQDVYLDEPHRLHEMTPHEYQAAYGAELEYAKAYDKEAVKSNPMGLAHHGPTVDGSHYFGEIAHDMYDQSWAHQVGHEGGAPMDPHHYVAHTQYGYEGHHPQHGLYDQPHHGFAPHDAYHGVDHALGHGFEHGYADHGLDHVVDHGHGHEWATDYSHFAPEHHDLGHHDVSHGGEHHGFDHGEGHHGFEHGEGHHEAPHHGFDYGHGDFHHAPLVPHAEVVEPHQGPLVVQPHELPHSHYHEEIGEHRRDVQHHEAPFRHAAAEAHALEQAHEATTGYIHPGFEPVHEYGLHDTFWAGSHQEAPHHSEYWAGAHHESPLVDSQLYGHHGYGDHGEWGTGHHGEWATGHQGYGEHVSHFRPSETDHQYNFEDPHIEEPHYLHDEHHAYTPGYGYPAEFAQDHHGYEHLDDHHSYDHHGYGDHEALYYDPFVYGFDGAHHDPLHHDHTIDAHHEDPHHFDDHHFEDHHVNPQAIHEAYEAKHGQDHVVYGDHPEHLAEHHEDQHFDAHHEPVHHEPVHHEPVHHEPVHHDEPKKAAPKPAPKKEAKKTQAKDDVDAHLQSLWYQEKDDTCWKKAYGRGVGVHQSACPAGKVRVRDHCVNPCKDGYEPDGEICWELCPHEFLNDGAFCYKPASYGRGAGHVEQHQGHEKWGALWYPECRENFHNVGCCVCSPDCPAGMDDIGISCAKNSYNRDITDSEPLICPPELVESGSLCYPDCSAEADGIGPVCWGGCPAGTAECGALCLRPGQTCNQYVSQEVKSVFKTIIDVALENHPGELIDIASIHSDLHYPNCLHY